MRKFLALIKRNGEEVAPDFSLNADLTVQDIMMEIGIQNLGDGTFDMNMDEYKLALILENEQMISELGMSDGTSLEIRYGGLGLPHGTKKRRHEGSGEGTSGGSQQPTEDIQAQPTESLVWFNTELLPLYKPIYQRIVSLPPKMKIKLISQYDDVSKKFHGIE